jgi:hypothetical protein
VGRHRVEIEATGYHDFAIDDEQAFAEAFQRRPRSPLGQNPVPAAYNERSELTDGDRTEPGPRELRFDLSYQRPRQRSLRATAEIPFCHPFPATRPRNQLGRFLRITTALTLTTILITGDRQ